MAMKMLSMLWIGYVACLAMVPVAAVAAIASTTGAAPASTREEVAREIERLASTDAEERAEAGFRLRSMGPEADAAIPALVKVLGDDTPTRPRTMTAEAVSRKVFAVFPSPGYEAAHTLSRLGGAALRPLMDAARGGNATVRLRATWSLQRWQDPHWAFMIAALKDPDADIRAMAATGLAGRLGVNPVVALIGALKDEDPHVRQAAVSSLGRPQNSEQAADAIIRVMKEDPDATVRETAVTSLFSCGDPRARDLLIEALGSSDFAVKNMAVQMVGWARDVQAVGTLLPMLSDKAESMRVHAATSLGQIKDVRAVAPLMALLADEDPRVRNAAMDALGKITGQHFAADEARWRKWWEQNKGRYPATKEAMKN